MLYLSIAVFIVQVCHKRETFSLHVVTPVPLASYLFTTCRAVNCTNMEVHFVCRLKFSISEIPKKYCQNQFLRFSKLYLHITFSPFTHIGCCQVPNNFRLLRLLWLLLSHAIRGCTCHNCVCGAGTGYRLNHLGGS